MLARVAVVVDRGGGCWQTIHVNPTAVRRIAEEIS
jgi:hypothetical protein